MNAIETAGIYRAVAPGHPAALVLVTGPGSAGAVTATLLSPDVEFASAVDLLVSRADTGLAYNLLAFSDVYGYLWPAQLDRFLARVPGVIMERLAALREQRPCALPAGPPVTDRRDPRWRFKLAELRRMQVLSAHCTRELIDG